MKHCAAMLAMVGLCTATLRADVTYTATITVEGQMAAMMGAIPPKMLMRVKGGRARTDIGVEGQPTASSITDLGTKRMILLQHDKKVAVLVSKEGATTLGPPRSITLPQAVTSVKATGQTKLIDGVTCAEHALTMSFSMTEIVKSAPQAPADILEAMKDVRLVVSGSLWVATAGPGVDDYVGFKKIAEEAGLAGVLLGAVPGMRAGGINQFMTAFSTAPGLPYLSEINMTVEGAGEFAEMMRQEMGTTKFITRVSALSTDPIADGVFDVPDGYTVTQR